MKLKMFFIGVFSLMAIGIYAQKDTLHRNFWKPSPPNYEVRHAFEVESLIPMFVTGGYHFAICYRYKKIRIRASIINGGQYDAEPAGLNNSSPDFKRFYKTSPGLFVGYNIWKNLELYSYLELHTFKIEQQNTGIQQDIRSTDVGGGLSYQFFLGRYFYIQPGFHVYLRNDKVLYFNNITYNIPNVDLSPVIRVGVRFWKRY